ncbi:MAG: adenylyl-sulfate kinase, partial [Rhodospirillales bacterium]|nr:adenylyl-sulfate kinase [Rhodospirillales bacterium]
AVNKMDLVDFDQATFEQIEQDYRAFAAELGLNDIQAIPLSALTGDNVFSRTDAADWYSGPSLLEILETIDVTTDLASAPFRMPVQWVNRPNLDFRGFSGTIASGTIKPGDNVMVSPSEKASSIKTISTFDGDLGVAVAGQSVTLVLNDEIDISRGDLMGDIENSPQQTDQFAAHILWMHEEELLPERQYLMKIGPKTVVAVVTELKHEINVNSLEHTAAKTVKLNEVAYVNFSLDHAIAYDPYKENRETGAFILIDRFSNATVGCGMIDFGLRRATNLGWHEMDVGKASRAKQKNQKACTLWFTGLSGSGKSTVANAIEKKLQAMGRHTYLLDGDNVRHGLNRDLGFTDADRVENVRRVAEVSALFVDAGMIVLSSFISPFRDERRMAREMLEDGEFFEVFVDTPLEVCEQRDPKGLYVKARAGEIKNFTGIDSDYEPPINAEIVLKSAEYGVEELADQVLASLKERGYI